MQLLVDGQVVARIRAGRPRPDVARVHPDYGRRHGYVIWADADPGRHEVCMEAIDVGKHRGPPVNLGCKTVNL